MSNGIREYEYSGALNVKNVTHQENVKEGNYILARGCGTVKGWMPCITCHAEFGTAPCHRQQERLAERDLEKCYAYSRPIQITDLEQNEDGEIIVSFRGGQT